MKKLVYKINRRIPNNKRDDKYIEKYSHKIGMILPFDSEFNKEVKEVLELYGDSVPLKRRKLKQDILCEFIENWILPLEYYQFDFTNKTKEKRAEYLSDYLDLKIFKNKNKNILPNNKFERYKLFESKYKRDVVNVSRNMSFDEKEKYREFISNNKSFIVKTIYGCKGHGVFKYDMEKRLEPDEFLDIVKSECILESLIDQGQELAAFHANSVNTVRMVTCMNKKGEFYYLFALLRVGQGGSIVDNVGSGGLVSMIDLETGNVCSDAFCRTKYYELHPDTKVRFKGTKIPEWDKLLEIAKQLHTSQPRQCVFGFDFAWTTSGWDIVEVNPAPSFRSYQTFTRKGIRPLLKSYGLL